MLHKQNNKREKIKDKQQKPTQLLEAARRASLRPLANLKRHLKRKKRKSKDAKRLSKESKKLENKQKPMRPHLLTYPQKVRKATPMPMLSKERVKEKEKAKAKEREEGHKAKAQVKAEVVKVTIGEASRMDLKKVLPLQQWLLETRNTMRGRSKNEHFYLALT